MSSEVGEIKVSLHGTNSCVLTGSIMTWNILVCCLGCCIEYKQQYQTRSCKQTCGIYTHECRFSYVPIFSSEVFVRTGLLPWGGISSSGRASALAHHRSQPRLTKRRNKK